MINFLKNSWWALVLIAGFLIFWYFWPGKGGKDYQEIQRRYDSVYSAIQSMKLDSAVQMHIDSLKILQARKKQDSLKLDLELANARADRWQATADLNEDAYLKALAGLDTPTALKACAIGFKSYDSFKVAVNVERSIHVQQLHQKDVEIEGLNSLVETNNGMFKALDSAYSDEHAHGQQLTKEVVKQAVTIHKQGTIIKILAGVAAAAIAILIFAK